MVGHWSCQIMAVDSVCLAGFPSQWQLTGPRLTIEEIVCVGEPDAEFKPIIRME